MVRVTGAFAYFLVKKFKRFDQCSSSIGAENIFLEIFQNRKLLQLAHFNW